MSLETSTIGTSSPCRRSIVRLGLGRSGCKKNATFNSGYARDERTGGRQEEVSAGSKSRTFFSEVGG